MRRRSIHRLAREGVGRERNPARSGRSPSPRRPSAGRGRDIARGPALRGRRPVRAARSPIRRIPPGWPAPASRPGAAAVQMSARWAVVEVSASRVALAAARLFSRRSCPVAASASARCSSVMANALIPREVPTNSHNHRYGGRRICESGHNQAGRVDIGRQLLRIVVYRRVTGVRSPDDGSTGHPVPRTDHGHPREMVAGRRPLGLPARHERGVDVTAGDRQTP